AVLARDGRIDPQPGIQRRHRRVGAEGQLGAVVQQGTKGIGVARPRAPHLVGRGPVGLQVDGLHGGKDAVLRQARQVVGMDKLHVLNAVRRRRLAGRRRRGQPLRQHVEHLAHGPVADGVHRERETGARGAHGDLSELLRRCDGDAAIVGLVLKRRQHPGRARAHRAVGEGFEMTDPQPLVAKAGLQTQRGRFRHKVGRQVHVDAQLEGVVAAQRLPQPEALRAFPLHALVVDAGQPQAMGLRLRLQQPAAQQPLVRRRDVGLDEGDGVPLAQNAGGMAGGVALDLAFRGIGGGGADAGCAQGGAVDPPGVHVHAGQRHGYVGRDGVQQRGVRSHVPQVFVPAPAQHPLAGRGGRGSCRHALAHDVKVGDAEEADLPGADGDLQEVDVGVDEAGQYQPPPSVDAARVGSGQGRYVGVGTDGEDTAVATGDRCGERPLRIHGVNLGVVKRQIRKHQFPLFLHCCIDQPTGFKVK
ncbi:hypothetical protein RZS08_06165, partial [Arthrospira platensis SPKY1]|nr:hypothetical protein [Arthrospira platensis SPKY1]